MDKKNQEALAYGREYMLAKLANLSSPTSPQDTKPAEEFKHQFGELYPNLDLVVYQRFALSFRYHWMWKKRKPHEQMDTSAWVANVLNRRLAITTEGQDRLVYHDPSAPPVLEVDFPSGRFKFRPETLLDWLVLSLLECRQNLAICERKECPTPCFVKTHPRAKYCSEACFQHSRLEQKNQWWRENRSKGAKRAAKRTAQSQRKRERQ